MPTTLVGWIPSTISGVRLFRRVLMVLGIAAAIGGVSRIVGKGPVPQSKGGWRPLDHDTLR